MCQYLVMSVVLLLTNLPVRFQHPRWFVQSHTKILTGDIPEKAAGVGSTPWRFKSMLSVRISKCLDPVWLYYNVTYYSLLFILSYGKHRLIYCSTGTLIHMYSSSWTLNKMSAMRGRAAQTLLFLLSYLLIPLQCLRLFAQTQSSTWPCRGDIKTPRRKSQLIVIHFTNMLPT